MKLKEKVAIVTGATSGIGKAIAIRFGQEGAKVAAVGRNQQRLSEVTETIESAGGKCIVLQADLLQLSEIEKVVERTVEEFGRLDILVNSAGIFKTADFLEISEGFFNRSIGINLKSLFFLSQKAAKAMKKQGRGKVINIASQGGGKVGFALGSVYCASKGAVVSLTQALAIELAPYKINVNAISPGTVKTPLNEGLFIENPEFFRSEVEGTPWGRLGETSDIAPAAVYLASEESDFVTGIQIVIDGGFSAQ